MSKPRCPRCGSTSRPIVYGMVGADLFEAADRGEIVVGGCVVADDAPGFECVGVDCGIRFTPARASDRGRSGAR